MEKNGPRVYADARADSYKVRHCFALDFMPRVYADARADSYEQSEMHHMYSCSLGRVVPIYIRLFPRSAYIAVIYRTEGRGRRLCIVQGRAQAFSLEEIHELFWCCSALMIILTGCHPMYFISAMLGVKKNEDAALITPTHPKSSNSPAITIHVTEATTKPDREIYLTTRRQAIELKLDASENIKVRLVGGNALDEQSIIWAVDKSDVLSLVGTTGKEIIVRGLTSGTARLTVSHPDAALPLAITVNVRDAVRTLSLSRTRINMEASDTNKPLTLTIRGGFNTDYDDVIWESSDNNVARIFGSGKDVTVNRIGVGQAVITATLTTTGQTAACNVTVLPDRYIIIPAGNIQVDRDVTTPMETEIRFHPSTLEISLTTNNSNASVVREGNKLKITGHEEGQTLLTATAGGGLGLKATLNITTYVTRDIIYPTGIINKSPGETFNLDYTVIPADEKNQIIFSLQYLDRGDIDLIPNTATGRVSIKLLKETNNALVISDPRNGGKGSTMIPIRSSFKDISGMVIVTPASRSLSHSVGDEWKPAGETDSNTQRVSISMPDTINKSVTFEVPSWPHRHHDKGNEIYITRVPNQDAVNVTMTSVHLVAWTAMRRKTISYDLHYTIRHGAALEKTHRGKVTISVTGYYH